MMEEKKAAQGKARAGARGSQGRRVKGDVFVKGDGGWCREVSKKGAKSKSEERTEQALGGPRGEKSAGEDTGAPVRLRRDGFGATRGEPESAGSVEAQVDGVLDFVTGVEPVGDLSDGN